MGQKIGAGNKTMTNEDPWIGVEMSDLNPILSQLCLARVVLKIQ